MVQLRCLPAVLGFCACLLRRPAKPALASQSANLPACHDPTRPSTRAHETMLAKVLSGLPNGVALLALRNFASGEARGNQRQSKVRQRFEHGSLSMEESGTISLHEGLAANKRAARAALGCSEIPLRLPLVSVIIVNFNYAHFLKNAVDSVFGQTYPNIECIAVENGSTDDSDVVLDTLAVRYPNLKVIRQKPNIGQTRAALLGLAASRGQYIIFLDADDFLLPECVETHVFVHLSLRIHTGFTSGDVLQLMGDEVVLGTEFAFNRILQTRRGRKPRAVRSYRHPAGEAWPRPEFAREVLANIRFVGPTREWYWSPTSGNCFRRDALSLFADNPALQSLTTSMDLYFCLGVNAISGSVLIDKPVAAYRLHGGNNFSQRPQLNHVLCYEPGSSGDSNDKARAALAGHLVREARRFVGRGFLSIEFLWLLWRMDCKSIEKDAPRWAKRSRAAAALVENYVSIASLLGTWPIKLWLVLRRVPLKVIFRLGRIAAEKREPKA